MKKQENFEMKSVLLGCKYWNKSLKYAFQQISIQYNVDFRIHLSIPLLLQRAKKATPPNHLPIMNTQHPKEVISRKEALQRMGKYAALTAMGTFIILNPKTAQAQSPGNRPEGGDNFREPSASGSSGNKGNGLGQGNAYKDKDKTNPKFFTDNDIWN